MRASGPVHNPRMKLAVAAIVLVLCGSAEARGTGSPLHDAHACPGVPGYTCSTLDVPLDHSGRRTGMLHLAVGAANDVSAPRGILLVLAGGPGQPGLGILGRFVDRALSAVAKDYRIVVFDQRGTGAGALRCSALQDAMGSSDLAPPPASAVRACARAVGDRRQFFGTDDTVADMDALRQALGVDKWALDGISYGTYVGERYALAHPDRVTKLVADSVVPHVGIADAGAAEFRAVRRVLGSLCGSCNSDLATTVKRYHNGPALLDALTVLSLVDPTYQRRFDVPRILHDAARGDRAGLDDWISTARGWQATPAEELDQGLHASTLCADWRWPWGTSAAPLAGRAAKLARAAAKVDPYPFDRATVTGNGFIRQCLPWAPTTPTPLVTRKITVPTLLLEGDRDLSCNLEWAREELKLTTRGKLVVVHGAGHSAQSRAVTDVARNAVRDFLLR
jgi:pimeloyl-ACP methyl ester carboxylesterase